ncbi:MAG: zinc-dependent metalloprotease, partial [Planctomycetia bacterium]
EGFKPLGFANAVEVMDLPDGADPEDTRYNTFRWITTGAGFAMGPSRVDPRTGQILDADIIFDADMVRYWQMEFDELIKTRGETTLTPAELFPGLEQVVGKNEWHRCTLACRMGDGMRHQMSMLGVAHLTIAAAADPKKELPDEIIGQAVREVTMHEVGHTLGLRHNFKSSTWKSLEEINTAKAGEPTVGSVMDYAPANIQPKGKPQGQYFPSTIGPYDRWVIEYGYTVLTGDEKEKLAAIASRSGQPELTYATDEDTRMLDPDPLSFRFDLGSDPIAYGRQQVELAKSLMPGIVDKVTAKGDGYEKARRAFSVLLSTQLQSGARIARFVGGQYTTRAHKGDPNGKLPFEVVPAAKQIEALDFLRDHLFSDADFKFNPELLNSLGPNRWYHWGNPDLSRIDYPLHDQISRYQSMVLSLLLNPTVLDRIRENELRTKENETPFTTPDLFRILSSSIWSELDPPAKPAEAKPAEVKPADPKPAAEKAEAKAEPKAEAKAEPKAEPKAEGKPDEFKIGSLRRALQREYVKRLIALRLADYGAPEDARALASMHLTVLAEKIQAQLPKTTDDYTRAHLLDARDRIQRALAASFQQISP